LNVFSREYIQSKEHQGSLMQIVIITRCIW